MRLAGLIAPAAIAAAPAAAQEVPIALAPGEVLLQVQAEGEHRSRPDVMTVTAGVVSTGRTAKEALAGNAAAADRVVEALRMQGVTPEDMRTSELTVDPQIDPADQERADAEDREPRIVGYLAKNQLEVRLRDLRRAPDVIDALFKAGANSIGGPRFALSDPLPAQREARRAAVAQARVEADTYAEALGMRVLRVLRVSERGRFDYQGGEEIVVTGSRIRRTPIEPGELTTSINVWIDYAMVPR